MLPKSWIILAGILAAPPQLQATEPAAAASPSAPSPQDRVLAERHYKEAVAAFEEKRWTVAVVEFTAAYQLSHEPLFLHNLSLTVENQGQIAEAIRYAESYLREVGGSLPRREGDEVRGRLARLREELGNQAAGKPAPSDKPLLPPLLVSQIPQPPLLAGFGPGRPLSESAGTQTEQPEHKVEPRRAVPQGALALTGVGAGLVLIGIGCGAGALATAQSLDGTPMTLAQLDGLTQRGQALNAAAITLDVVGGLALVGGAGWFLWHRLRRAPSIAFHQAGLQFTH